MEQQMQEVQGGITFATLWKVLKKGFLFMIVAAVLFGALGAVYTRFFEGETYTAEVKFVVSTSSGAQVAGVSSDLLSVATAKTTVTEVVDNLKSIQTIKEDDPEEYDRTIDAICSMVTASPIGSNALFSVSVSATAVSKDAEEAVKATIVEVAQAYEMYLPDYVANGIYAGRNVYIRMYEECDGTYTVSRPYTRNIILAALIGAVAAFAVFFVLEMIDRRVYTAKNLETVFADIPVLASIPEKGDARIAEAYRALRTNVTFAVMTNKRKNVLAVTGTRTGEGKSAIVVNLAAAFGELGKRVLVVDGDLREGEMKELYSLEGETGLSDYLAGGVEDYKACISKNVAQGVDVLIAGAAPTNPSELLASDKMTQLLKDVRAAYDLVLVDLPAIGEVTDAGVLVPVVDHYLFAVRAGFTNVEQVKESAQEMERLTMRLGGFVLVDVK